MKGMALSFKTYSCTIITLPSNMNSEKTGVIREEGIYLKMGIVLFFSSFVDLLHNI